MKNLNLNIKKFFNFLKPKQYTIMELLKNENSVEIILKKLAELSNLDLTPVKSFTNPLSIARKNRRLPSTGFLAGGAVCNTILSLLDGKNYLINDIDIFHETNDKESQCSTANRNDETNLHIAAYGELMTLDNRATSYRIISTEREGLFNDVYISKPNVSINGEKYLYILKGFDINCCMVGIDLETKKLVYTKDFEEFLNHRQLMVSNPYTPAHTSMRLIKKKEELGVYLDIEKEFKYLSQVYLMFPDPYFNGLNRVFGNFFSEKYKDLYDKYKNIMSEYFDILTFIEAKTRSHKINNLKETEIPKYLLDLWEKNSHLYALLPKKFTKPEYYLDFIPPSARGPISLKKIWKVLERSTKSEITKAKMILENSTTRQFFFVVDGFHKCDFNEKNIEDFTSLVSGNEILINAIVVGKLNLQESLNFIRMIKSMVNKESSLFVDIIVDRIVKDYGSLDKSKLLNKEFVKTIFEDEKSKRSSFLVTPTEMGDFEFKGNVYELVTEYDLLFGSRLLHNCMSNPAQNYKSKIISGVCKLFVIETENNYSGVEMEYNFSGYKLKTVLGVTNKQACEKHIYIANYLTSFLNHRHWLLKSNEVLEKLHKSMGILSEKVKSSDDTKLPNRGIDTLMINRLGGEGMGLNFNFNNMNLVDGLFEIRYEEPEQPLPF